MVDEVLAEQLGIESVVGTDLTDCEPNAKGLKSWLKELPVTNLDAMVQPVSQMAKELSQLNVPGKTLLECVEVINGTAFQLMEYLENKFVLRVEGLDSVATQAVKVVHSINQWMIEIYLHAIVDPAVRKKNRVLAVGRAMEWLFHYMLRCYYLYLPVNALIWSRLNRLVLLVHEEELDGMSVEMAGRDQSVVSLTNLYLQSVVLSSINPSQLQYQQLKALSFQCPLLASQIQVIFDHNDVDSNALFEVDVNGARPPIYRNRTEQRTGGYQTIWLLGFSRIVAAVEKKPSANDEVALKIYNSLSDSVRHQMLRVWTQPPQRNMERIETDVAVESAIGIDVNFALRSGGLTADGFLNALREKEPLMSGEAAVANVLHTGRVVNYSEGRGACVRFDKMPESLVSGAPISIKIRGLWVLGLVRWIRRQGAGVDCGVELVSTECQPCAIRVASEEGTWGPLSEGMLSVRDNSGYSHFALVTAGRVSVNSMGLYLRTEQRRCFVKITETFHLTGLVSISYFVEVPSDSLPPLAEAGGSQLKVDGPAPSSPDDNDPWRDVNK